jgi:hypothetical protein
LQEAPGILDCVSDGALPRWAWLDTYFVEFPCGQDRWGKRFAYFRCSGIRVLQRKQGEQDNAASLACGLGWHYKDARLHVQNSQAHEGFQHAENGSRRLVWLMIYVLHKPYAVRGEQPN